MANTLTDLIPVLFEAANTVSREQTGFISSVYIDPDLEQVAKDQVITYPIVASQTADELPPEVFLPAPCNSCRRRP